MKVKNEEIVFSETDYSYLESDTFEMADNLLMAADIKNDDYDDGDFLVQLEYALYHLKNTAKNKYNNDYFRILFYVLNKISENVENLSD